MPEEAGKGRYWRWNDTNNKETAARLARTYRGNMPKKTQPKAVEAPHSRANQPCFYDNGGTQDLVVDSNVGSSSSPSVNREFEDFKVRMNVEAADGEKFLRIEYRHANGHMVERWWWETPAQYESLRGWVRRKQQRNREQRERYEQGEVKVSRHTTHREFERKPILSTQLEPGVVVRCNSYKQFEREVERRGREIGDIR